MKSESRPRNWNFWGRGLFAEPVEVQIPQVVLENMVRTGEIETLEPKWLDERRYCRYAIDSDPAGAARCPSLAADSAGSWCSLNGVERRSPCVFAEPESATVWQEIKLYVDECKRKGWTL